MKKTALAWLVLGVQTAFGQLQAPYLYTADSVADTAVQLTWRNNSAAYVGIVVLRKAGAAGQYGAVDTAPGSATSLVDIVKPTAQTTYYYALTAYSQTEHADTSNSDSVVVRPRPTSPPMPPLNFAVLLDSLRRTVRLQFMDTSTSEIGVKIYRSTNFGTFTMLRDIPSAMLSDSLGYNPYPDYAFVNKYCADSTVAPNTWYVYYISSYNGQQELKSNKDTLFTINVDEIAKSVPRKCVTLDSIGSIPASPGGWCLRYGDTIVLNERDRPDSTTFSIIDVSKPASPRFAGIGKSDAARIVFGSEFLCKDNFVISMKGGIVNRYEYDGGGTFPAPVTANQLFVAPTFLPGFLSDSTVLAQYTFTEAGPCYKNVDARFRFSRNAVSFLDTAWDLSYDCRVAGQSTRPDLGWTFGNRYFAPSYYTAPYSSSSSASMLVMDFNYPACPRCLVNTPLVTRFPQIVDNILLDTATMPRDMYAFVDTVKNLVYAVFFNWLTVYNCRIDKSAVSTTIRAEERAQALRICKTSNTRSPLIILPNHSQPATVTIFDLSGRQLRRYDGIIGNVVELPSAGGQGVYVLRAVVDGKAFAARFVVTK